MVEYELIKQAPSGPKARRIAWLRKAGRVRKLLEKLSDCRATVIMALDSDCAVSARRSEAVLRELQRTVVERSDNLMQSLQDHDHREQRAHVVLMDTTSGILAQG